MFEDETKVTKMKNSEKDKLRSAAILLTGTLSTLFSEGPIDEDKILEQLEAGKLAVVRGLAMFALDLIEELGEVSIRDMARHSIKFRKMPAPLKSQAMRYLVKNKLVDELIGRTSPIGGRPTVKYKVKPKPVREDDLA